MTTEQLAGLEEQRDVLLKSLRDLDVERAAGEIGDDDYASLKDRYTARAAAVLRAIEAGRRTSSSASRSAARRAGQTPARRGRGGGRARSGGRGGGQARSGGRGGGRRPAGTTRGRDNVPPTTGPSATDPSATDPSAVGPSAVGPSAVGPSAVGPSAVGPSAVGPSAVGPSRRSTVSRRRHRSLAITLGVALAIVALAGTSVALFAGGRDPGQPVTGSVPGSASDRVAEALSMETQGQAVEALKLYDEVLRDDPSNVEALAYRGWLLKRAGLPDKALDSLDRAVASDPTFPDAHFFRGMVLYQDMNDPARAVAEFEAFLANDPPQDFVADVQRVLAEAQAAATARAAPAPAPDPAAPAG